MGLTDEIAEPKTESLDITRVLHALSDPLRLEIVRQLDGGDECRCGAFNSIGVSKSTVSHHLKTLREAGITRTRPSGTTRYLSLRRDELDERFPGLLDAVLSASART
jgi:DNA-binding transcriptional ArsR family regulator